MCAVRVLIPSSLAVTLLGSNKPDNFELIANLKTFDSR
jgi:hypothetical protein